MRPGWRRRRRWAHRDPLRDGRAAYEVALREHEQAVAAERSLTQRLEELDQALAAAPPLETVTADLARLGVLEEAAEQARAALAQARTARDAAEHDLRSLDSGTARPA